MTTTILPFPISTAPISRIITINCHGYFPDSSWFPKLAAKLAISVTGMTATSSFLSMFTEHHYTVVGTVEQMTELNTAMAAKYRQDADYQAEYDKRQIVILQQASDARPFKKIRSYFTKLGGSDMQILIATFFTISLLFSIPFTIAMFALVGFLAGTAALLGIVATIYLIRIAVINQDDLNDLAKIKELKY